MCLTFYLVFHKNQIPTIALQPKHPKKSENLSSPSTDFPLIPTIDGGLEPSSQNNNFEHCGSSVFPLVTMLCYWKCKIQTLELI